MPELAEVELSRRIWEPAVGERIRSVRLNEKCRIFRGVDLAALSTALVGSALHSTAARGKQMLFGFRPARRREAEVWLGVHLGMAGSLHLEATKNFQPAKHDHCVLQAERRALVFRDVRHFGRVRFDTGPTPPAWWTALPPEVTAPEFTLAGLSEFLDRRRRAPLKGVLLMQERFPGIGNWMADEILWRAGLHPATPAGSLAPAARLRLWEETRFVAAESLRQIDEHWDYPASWLFPHRWRPGGHCPRCGLELERATIGGRTTAWCERCQPRRRGRVR